MFTPGRWTTSVRHRRAITDPTSAISLPGYTAAELSAMRDLTGTRAFVVGDNATYGRYHNVPLTPDSVYVVYFVVAVEWDGVVKMAFSQLASPVRTAAKYVSSGDIEGPTTAVDRPQSPGQTEPGSRDDGQIMIAIVVCVGVFGLLAIAALVAAIIICWRRRRDDVTRQTGSDVIGRDSGESRKTSWMQYYSDHFNATDSSIDDVTESAVSNVHVTGSEANESSRDLLVAHIAGYKTAPFDDEFKQLPTTIDDGPAGTDEVTQCHRFLSGYRGRQRAYILTGAPSDASAVVMYWTVIYQEGITHVVSVGSGASDGAKTYQPEEGEERKFGSISVRTTVVKRLTHATTATFQIRRTDDDALSRRVHQYEFIDWPMIEQAVPSTALHFTEFVEVVRASVRRAQTGANLAPLLVRRPTHDDSGNPSRKSTVYGFTARH